MVKKLGLINIFAHQVEYPEYIVDDQATRALLLRGVLNLMGSISMLVMLGLMLVLWKISPKLIPVR